MPEGRPLTSVEIGVSPGERGLCSTAFAELASWQAAMLRERPPLGAKHSVRGSTGHWGGQPACFCPREQGLLYRAPSSEPSCHHLHKTNCVCLQKSIRAGLDDHWRSLSWGGSGGVMSPFPEPPTIPPNQLFAYGLDGGLVSRKG